MKTKLTLLITIFIAAISFAQNGINYKAVIKDTNDNVVANQSVTVQFSILKGAGQTNEYTETHNPTTDANGIIIVNIGEGTTSDDFSAIDWASDDHFLNVQVNIGSGLTDMGTTQFMAVPYALNVTGLQALDEGNGIGWRIKGRNPDFYGNIGIDADDFSFSQLNSNTNGATGDDSIAMGSHTTASGHSSTAIGSNTKASGQASIAMGSNTNAIGRYSAALGFNTNSVSYVSTVIGRYNIGGGNSVFWAESDPLFEIGNGTDIINTNNALTVLKNGTITAPSFDIVEITDNKSLITKEYADANYVDTTFSGDYNDLINLPTIIDPSGLEALDEGNGIGWRLEGRNPNYYGNVGFNAVDLSFANIDFGEGAIGSYSFAANRYAIASGFASIAMGNFSTASGSTSIAVGQGPEASGDTSVAFGNNTDASGSFSSVLGNVTRAESYSSTAIGSYNIGGGNPTSWVAADPLFEIGNGTSNFNRGNALTVLKNGNVGIGKANPTLKLEVSGEVNINESVSSGIALRVNGDEALWYNGNYYSWGYGTGTGYNFFATNVGLGMYNPNVRLDVNGSIEYTGTITDVSDKRLKENFESIENPLDKIKQITGLTYNMIDDETKKREHGVIAQDVQKIFPEMVSIVNTEKGYLGVSYIQLIPVLLEAIKEQQTIIEIQNSQLKTQDSKIETLSAELSELQNLAQRVNQIEKLLKTPDQYKLP